jgi:asparagine synthase (glutamine-hydrolysing)
MCGIYGEVILGRGGRLSPTSAAAVDTLEHRGPDERGTWEGDGVFLGMRRLSIIDLEGGQQPIFNEDKTLAIVYNGELYNFLDLRPELKARGHRFLTRSDTEVVLHAFEEWGPDCLRRFNGMFAFAIWDMSNRTLWLARDRIGEKPLYYYADGRHLVFGSEIKAILQDPSIPREVDEKGLANFLSFGHAVAPRTMMRGILKLPAGHFMKVSGGKVAVEPYWTVGDDPQAQLGLEEREYSERIRALLDDSVRRRMIADVPVGAFLSGGVDSSAIVALMSQHATGPVKTFSLGFTVGGAYDELSSAREVAAHLGVEHHELRVEHFDLVDALQTLVYHYDEPFGDPAGFPVYLLSRFARQHVKVVLTGDGGDELFGGYRRYVYDNLSRHYRILPDLITRRLAPAVVGQLPRLRRSKKALATLGIQDPARRYASWLRVFTPELLSEILDSDVRESLGGHDPAAHYSRLYGGLNGDTADDHLNRLMHVDVKSWLVDMYMEKTDKATMAASLEARLPLLDHRLVELAFAVPGSHKIKGLSTKRILKRAVADLVPESVLRKPKHGFEVPTDPWFKGDLKSWAFEVLLDDKARGRGYFKPAGVERLWKQHVSGRHVWDAQLWLLLNFELWHRRFIDEGPSMSAGLSEMCPT